MSWKKSWGSLSDAEEKLWREVTENITRLDSDQMATPLPPRAAYRIAAADSLKFAPPLAGQFSRAPAIALTEQSFMLRDADHKWQQKLRRGKLRPEGKIDLHGMTQDRAYEALCHYIEQAQSRGKRFILVVTGKGGRKSAYEEMSYADYDRNRGILKSNVPRWLSQGQLASRIISYYDANQEHGGDGALYVVLKRIRGS